jgi:hypothetical protein
MGMNKRGLALGDLYYAVLTITFVGIVIGIGLYVMYAVSEKIPGVGGVAINTTAEGLASFTNWVPLMIVIIAIAIVLSIVLSSFGNGGIGGNKSASLN